MRQVTVIGAGATGLAACAHLALSGHAVRLLELPGHEQDLAGLQDSGRIRLTGAAGNQEAAIPAICHDPEDALGDAEVVIVATVAQRHEQVAELCLPHLNRDQVVLITPGNLGSLVLHGLCRDRSRLPILAEVESNLYVVWRTGPASVELVLPPRRRYVSAFPAARTEQAIRALDGCYDLQKAQNVFETTLNLPNLDCHLPGMVLNAGLIQAKGPDFHFYRDGLGAAALGLMRALHEERVRVMTAMGLVNRISSELLPNIADAANPQFESFRRVPGPFTLSHRFVSEDAFAGVCFLVSLAAYLGMEVPVAEALLRMASVLDGRHYAAEGRSLRNLRLDGLTRQEMVAFLLTGERRN